MQSIRACRGLWFCLALMAPAASLSAEKNSAVIKDISYRGATTADRRTSLDLYLPPPSTVKPPLFIFVHGGFWLLSDDEYQIGPSIAANLSRDGVAVALVRYRLAPTYRHPAQAEDVAAAVGYLINPIRLRPQARLSGRSLRWRPLGVVGGIGSRLSQPARAVAEGAGRGDFDQRPLRSRALVERLG
jgi:BD-FAE